MEFRVCFTYTDMRDTDVDEPRIEGNGPGPSKYPPNSVESAWVRSVMVRLEFYHSPANSLAILP